MHRPHLLLLGYGHLNKKVAQTLLERFRISAVSRTPQSVPGGCHIAMDLSRDPLDTLPDDADLILFCLTPAKFDEENYRRTYLDTLKRLTTHIQRSPERFFFVSSTSVYGQNQDEVVDEESATIPENFSGQILAEAEQWLKQQSYPCTSVRFSGIYGAHRTRLLQQIINGEKSDQGPSGYTNRIHETDAVGVLCHLIHLAADKKAPLKDCYLASDNLPVRMHDLVAWVREQIPCQHVMSSGGRQRAGSKQCRNKRLRETGFEFIYPDYKAGYGEMIRDLSEKQKG
ncbi:sugar nucleotide-binding protein [Hahella ganghwensis]|uniref:sugar nucleotide-binding protein n=1 Tax=Hahella ganghwensis TaxID=286420 RepID=UPI00036D348C|nr:sugar nucleotide-binding protein [Hahella ganghwensis]